MKKITIYILGTFALLITVPTLGQNNIGVRHQTYTLEGDSVRIEMTVNLNNVQISNDSYILLTPSLKSNDALMDLPSVIINGRNRHKAFKRLVALNKAPQYIHSEINADNRRVRTYKYSIAVAYEPWMQSAKLGYKQESCNCGREIPSVSFEQLCDKLEGSMTLSHKDVEMNFLVSFKVPSPEVVKNRSESGKAYLDFAVGRSEIRPDFGNNALELYKIGELIREVKSNQYATITGIVIEGYASPEGSFNTNLTLSSGRASALKNHLKNNYDFSERIFSVTGKGEDWTTLAKLVEESGLYNSKQVLTIAQSDKPFDTRERELKTLNNGETFRRLLEEYFPRLRRSDYELQYTVVPFTVEKGKEVLKSAPKNLSLNEMFLIAQTYPTGSAEYKEVFEIAAKTFPTSDISNMNAAAIALISNNLESAEFYLLKITDRDAAYHNNMGVMYALKGAYEKASEQFAIARQGGNSEASANVLEVAKLNEVKEQIK